MNNDIKLLLSEDLSPNKISLLLLIEVAIGDIENDAQMAILATIVNHLHVDTETINQDLVVIPCITDLLSTLDLDVNGIFVEKFLEKVWSVDSIEALDTAVTNVYSLLQPLSLIYHTENRVSASGLVGQFIEKIYTCFKILKFDELLLLYDSYINYIKPSQKLLGHRKLVDVSQSPHKLSQSKTVSSGNSANSDEELFKTLNSQLASNLSTSPVNEKVLPVAKHDLQAVLNNQIHLLESYGTPTPQLLNQIMDLMTSPNSNICSIKNSNFNKLPQYHYIRYLECLQQLNYNGAFKTLHQYFDYLVASNSKHFYHFALISLATLHEFFGEDEKAIDSIEEAISVARENKDNEALTYILSWLFNFMKNKPQLWNRQSFYNNNNESQLLDILIKKSQLVSLNLCSMSYNFETLQIINDGGPMSAYLESLLKSTFISIDDNSTSFIKAAEMSSTIWSRIGNQHLSRIYNEVAIQSTKKKTDTIFIEIRDSFLQFVTGDPEGAHKRLEKLKHQVSNGDISLFNSIQVRSVIMSIKLCLIKGRFKMGKELISTLLCNDIKEIELKNELVLLHIEIEMALENYSHALQMISKELSQNPNSYLAIKLNLLKCKIFNISGNNAKGLTLLLQQIQKGTELGFRLIVSEGILIMVSMLNRLGYYEDAIQILVESIPTIISTGNEQLVSQGYYEIAMNYFKQYEKQPENMLVAKILKYLNLSIVGFKKCVNLIELTKCFELEQQVANLQGDKELIQHTEQSLQSLKSQSQEESIYGYSLGDSRLKV